MEKEILENHIHNGLSIRKIAKEENLSYQTISYWLKKFNLKTIHTGKVKNYKCIDCGETNKENFYGNQKEKCKSCRNKESIIRLRKYKEDAVKLYGGKCKNCGYDKCLGALEFHHPNDDKSIDYRKMRNWSIEAKKEELDKCELLCANCHREEHYNIVE